MKYPGLLLVFFLTACAVVTPGATPTAPPSPTAAASPTPEPITFTAPNFIFQGQDPGLPIVTHNPSTEIRNLYINPGAVLFHDGQFHMFFNSFTTWPGVVEIGYMTSEDGYRWQLGQETPVFITDQIPFGDGKADVSSAIVLADGTWAMYFHTVGGGEIGRATAGSPQGPWTVEAEPVLQPGAESAWDRLELGWPSVVQDDREYRMYYGVKTDNGFAIGMAISTDGLHWEKYDDPDTLGVLYAESDPVLTADVDWEYNKVDRPRVVKSPDGWVMIYQAGTRIEERGLALSDDGIHWEKYPDNPVFHKEVFPLPNARTWDTNLLYQDGTYYYFMELGTLNGTDLYLTTHQGSLRQ